MNDITHLTLQKPPVFLFCAVEGDLLMRVLKQGLNRRKMPFIVMYESEYVARRKLPFKKSPVVLTVLSEMMAEDGYQFAHAETGEWVTDETPAKYLRICG